MDSRVLGEGEEDLSAADPFYALASPSPDWQDPLQLRSKVATKPRRLSIAGRGVCSFGDGCRKWRLSGGWRRCLAAAEEGRENIKEGDEPG